jgi:hypothetical protein
MSKVISAHQPNYMPNLAFFYKMMVADLFVIITNLQFERQEGWQRRNRFENSQGVLWLTVPLLGSQNQKVKEVRISNERHWARKHISTLKMNYGKFADKNMLSKVEEIYSGGWGRLVDLNVSFIKFIREELEISTPIIVDEEVSGKKHEFIINLCKKYSGDVYLSGNGAGYMDSKRIQKLEKNKIEHTFIGHNYLNDYKFSALHYLLKYGKEKTLQLLKKKVEVVINV